MRTSGETEYEQRNVARFRLRYQSQDLRFHQENSSWDAVASVSSRSKIPISRKHAAFTATTDKLYVEDRQP